MTATLVQTPRTTGPTAPYRTGRLLRAGVAATAVACLATTGLAAAGRAAGISLHVAGAPIPLLGFATLTAVCCAVGLVLAVALGRWARHPARTFVATTVVLTVVSWLPDLLVDAAWSTRALLMLTHLAAAVVVVPAVARRLPD
jgi:hypothetical protein